MKNKLFAAAAVISIFVVTSCDNKNLFGKFHKAGSSSSVEVLLSDANAALANDNPAEAKAIADKILINNPNNSEALYISAAAGLKEAGFDVAGIITSVIGSTSTADADSLLESFANLDINAIAKAISKSVEQLKQIADGNTDGVISYKDIDVNLNLGILEVLDAVLNIIDFNDNYVILNDTSDVVNVDDNYNVTVKVGTGPYKSVGDLTDADIVQLKNDYGDDLANKVNDSIAQVETAVAHFTTAADGIGGDGSSTMNDLKNTVNNDLKSALDDFYSKLTSTSTP
ncbi:hypothetical protein KJ633_01085 [bacterium]|nr:hypothetical protein [bacterium]MBU3955035.1 hypothetical protein [bacterium]